MYIPVIFTHFQFLTRPVSQVLAAAYYSYLKLAAHKTKKINLLFAFLPVLYVHASCDKIFTLSGSKLPPLSDELCFET